MSLQFCNCHTLECGTVNDVAFPLPLKSTLTSFAITPVREAHLRCRCKSSDEGTYKVDHNKVIMGVPCAAATGAL